MDVGQAVVTDICDPSPELVVEIIRVDGVDTLSPYTPDVALPQGETVIRYTATDIYGNTVSDEQHVVIDRGASCCPPANINVPQSKLLPGTYAIEPRSAGADRIEAVVQRHLVVEGTPSSEAWVLDTGTLTIDRADGEVVTGAITARKANDPTVELVGRFSAAVCNATTR